ncbi:MAG: glycosyltransferase family 4 protein [Betaproteobacteria bacterium]
MTAARPVERPLRLAIIRQRWNPFGGAERFVDRAVHALLARGVDATLLARHWQSAEGLRTERLDPFYLGSVWRDAGFARAARAAVARGGYDLVQSHERIDCCHVYRAGDGVHRAWLERRARAEGGAWRALSPFHRYTLAAEARLFASPRLEAVICNAGMVRDEIERHFGVDPARLHVIRNGVDTAAFSPSLRSAHRERVRAQLGIAADEPVFLFVGSGFGRKGVATALQALASVPAGTLVVVGGDKHAARYQALAGRLGLGPRTRFTGPQQDAKPFYGAADAFVLPTLYDPFPNAALEALACALPVITTDGCGAAEVLHDPACGLVVPAGDVPALAAAMAHLLDATTRDAMGTAARAVARRHSLEAMTDALLALYGHLLADR